MCSRPSRRAATTAISASSTGRRPRRTRRSSGSKRTVTTVAVESDAAARLRAGFIGLGVMGAPMAQHLLAAGFGLTVHSRTHGRVEALVAAGAVDGALAAGVGAESDV